MKTAPFKSGYFTLSALPRGRIEDRASLQCNRGGANTNFGARVAAETLQSSAEIGLAVGAVINKFKVKKLKKHVDVDIKDRHFAFSRSAAKQR